MELTEVTKFRRAVLTRFSTLYLARDFTRAYL